MTSDSILTNKKTINFASKFDYFKNFHGEFEKLNKIKSVLKCEKKGISV